METSPIKAILCDIGGVLYIGDTPTPGAVEAIAQIKKYYPIRFLTNTAQKTSEQVVAKLQSMGFDIDASEINKNVEVEVGGVGDLKNVLIRVLDTLENQQHPHWMERIAGWRRESKERDVINRDVDSPVLLAAEVIHDLWDLTEGDATVVTDVGQHQMWVAQYYAHSEPNTLITSGGMGTMGYGLPAAIGASMGCPDRQVWVVVGDGGFQMTMAELATAMQEKVNVKIALINNGYLGMVRQWQEMFYEERYNETPMIGPDFCKLADAYGIPSVRVEHRDQIEAAVRQAQDHEGGPFLIEFVVKKLDVVFPMVPAGADLHDMIRRPTQEENLQKESLK